MDASGEHGNADAGSVPGGAAVEPLRRNREYLAWLVGDFSNELGSSVDMFALPLVTFQVTGSVAAAGTVGFVGGIGGVLGLLPGGVLADRADRRRLRIASAGTGLVLMIVLGAVLLAGMASVAALAILLFLDRLRATLLGSASHTMLKQIVPASQLPAAFAVNEGRAAVIELGASPLSGLLLGVNRVLPFAGQALGHVANLMATALLRGDYSPPASAKGLASAWRDVVEAVRWSFAQAVRVQLMGVVLLANLATQGIVMLVTLSLGEQGVAPGVIGLVMSVAAVGLLLGALGAGTLSARFPTGPLMIILLVVMCAACGLFALTPTVLGSAAAVFLMGLATAPISSGLQGFFMHITPKEMLGRVGALSSLASLGLLPLAPAAAGWGLDLIGVQGTRLLFAGIMVVSLVIALIARQIRQIPVAAAWREHAKSIQPASTPAKPQ